jgi:hypothetical protein
MFKLKFTLSILCFGFLISPTYAFQDLPADDPQIHIFNHLRDVQVILPDSQNYFYPEKLITRAEGLTFALRAGGVQIPNDFDGQTFYADVDPNSWYANVINRAVKVKFLKPRKRIKNYFRPTEIITRAEYLELLLKTTKAKINISSSINLADLVKDIKITDPYYRYFVYADKYGLFPFASPGLYEPNKPLNKRELAIITFQQLKIFHGQQDKDIFVELEVSIGQLIKLISQGNNRAAQIRLHSLNLLTHNISLKNSNQDTLAAKLISISIDHLIQAVRAFNFKNNLLGIENLFLAEKTLQNSAKDNTSLLELRVQLKKIIEQAIEKL